MFLSPTEAVKTYDVSKPTLYADMKEGKLSYDLDNRDRRRINVAELERIYEKRKKDNVGKEALESVKSQKSTTSSDLSVAEVTIKHLQEMRDTQKEHYESEIETLKDALKRAQEGQNKALLLLEDKRSGGGNWEKSIKALETRISNSEKSHKELIEAKEKSEQELARYKRALRNERSKSWLDKLLGRNPKRRPAQKAS